MKDFENDLIYYPNPDPVKEPRFILKSVDELEKSTDVYKRQMFRFTTLTTDRRKQWKRNGQI